MLDSILEKEKDLCFLYIGRESVCMFFPHFLSREQTCDFLYASLHKIALPLTECTNTFEEKKNAPNMPKGSKSKGVIHHLPRKVLPDPQTQ